MEIKPEQVILERYDYLLPVVATQFFSIKSRPGQVIEMVNISIYNASANNITKIYLLVKSKGVISYLHFTNSLTSKYILRLSVSVFISGGDEIGVQMIGNTVNDPVQIAYNGIIWGLQK